MSIISVIGIMLAVLAGIVLLCLGVTRMEKTAKSSEYDERQQLVRGRGYRLAFFVGILFMLVAMSFMVYQVDGEKTVEPYLLVYFGLILQATVFHVYCLLNHAALPFSEKPGFSIVCYAFIGLMDFFAFKNAVGRWPLTFVGHGTTGWNSLVQMFFWFSLSAMHLIQLLRREKE